MKFYKKFINDEEKNDANRIMNPALEYSTLKKKL
jgi:hypothetical protein